MTDFLLAAWRITLELAPWLLLGTAVSGALHVFLPAGFLQRSLTGRGGVWKAVLFGVPLPLCSCGVIPAGIGLKKDGASDGAALGFLVSTPQTGVDSMLVSASFLGWPFALFKVGAAIVTGIIAGTLTEATGAAASMPPTPHAARTTPRNMRAFITHVADVLASLWKWLVIGILASAFISIAIPASAFASLAAQGAAITSLAVLVISVPLYVCALASVPIAAALVAGGLPSSAAMVFLMAGPATNIATMGAIHHAFGKRPLIIYLVTIIVGSLVAGGLFDAIVNIQAVPVAHLVGHDDHTGPIALASAVVLSTIVAVFAVRAAWDAIGRLRARRSKAPQMAFTVTGMSCGGCASKLERALRAVNGVTAVTVAHDPGSATVAGYASCADVLATIEAVGYTASACDIPRAPA